MHVARMTIRLTAPALALTCALLNAVAPASAQPAAPPPPAVGIMDVVKRPVTESSEFLGRIEATNRVAVVARVTAFLEKRSFVEGAEVKTGDLLYQLERVPFQADLESKKAQVLQLQATLENAKLTTNRAQTLLSGPAGQQPTYDAAIATQRSLEAQVQAAQAQVDLSQINLDYTEIHSPIDGKIGRTAVTEGNVVTPSSGVLTTIVSQDPMYVTFPVSVREGLALRERYAARGGFKAVVIKLRLPTGRLYDQTGELNFVEFVTVLLQGVEPVEVLAVPRAAVLSDQQGEYVFTVGADNKAVQRRIQLGQSTPTVAAVTSGIALGDKVIVEGLQKVRPGQPVNPGPGSALIEASMNPTAADTRAETAGGSVRPATKPAGATP